MLIASDPGRQLIMSSIAPPGTNSRVSASKPESNAGMAKGTIANRANPSPNELSVEEAFLLILSLRLYPLSHRCLYGGTLTLMETAIYRPSNSRMARSTSGEMHPDRAIYARAPSWKSHVRSLPQPILSSSLRQVCRRLDCQHQHCVWAGAGVTIT